MGQRVTVLLLPFVVLGLTRLGAEVSSRLFPMRVGVIVALAVYYAAIAASVLWVRQMIPAAKCGLSFFPGTRPSARRLAVGVVLPALPLCGLVGLKTAPLPPAVLGAIVCFAVINASFEEVFWRGLMAQLPAPDRARILYSAALFALGHWLIMGAYMPMNPRILVAMVVSTFTLGVVWMWFYLRERSLAYTIASHLAVDVLSLLAVAMRVQPHLHP
jgi:membrane protease YdiL (CAAX protease family)